MIRLDSGWLYVIAGLALCAAGILVPARRDLEDLHRQADRMAQERARGQQRVEAYEEFLQLLADDDPALLRRLAAAQLNLVPADDTPVLLAASRTASVAEWVEDNVQAPPPQPSPTSRATVLDRMVGGPRRLWVLAGGILVVFVGLLLDDVRTQARSGPRPVIPRWPAASVRRGRRRGRRPDGRQAACGDRELNPWFDE